MRVGRIELREIEKGLIRTYLLKGLTEQDSGSDYYPWSVNDRVVVGMDGVWRIVEGNTWQGLILDYPWVKLPPVPLSSGLLPKERTTWLQIAIAIADQVGLTDDPEVMGAIERRVTEEVVEGQITRTKIGSVALTEGGQSIRQFAWSEGRLAAEVDGTWRLPNGQAVEVTGPEWAIVAL